MFLLGLPCLDFKEIEAPGEFAAGPVFPIEDWLTKTSDFLKKPLSHPMGMRIGFHGKGMVLEVCPLFNALYRPYLAPCQSLFPIRVLREGSSLGCLRRWVRLSLSDSKRVCQKEELKGKTLACLRWISKGWSIFRRFRVENGRKT